MSRIGKHPVEVPSGVTVTVNGQEVIAKGKLGELTFVVMDEVVVTLDDGKVTVAPKNDTRRARQMWATARTRINNLVVGVSEGYKKELEITGVGYRAAVKGSNLELQLGFSHDVIVPIPSDLQIACPSQTEITISGADKQKVGQIAAEIRDFRPPEPYKGKGVRYKGEYILRKEGKKK
ncbi:50S ribosomal protein L6 [Terasakiella pusilla]|jgi:large subunit ribosomal protein L6|uniref:50S ribosomal protein L6 n=1 Tax=Terasakiella pusilla TaxID=64973 RepID=UPI00048C6151|nr:50S ribosomal protein L6 [Terasakiella pusilla]